MCGCPVHVFETASSLHDGRNLSRRKVLKGLRFGPGVWAHDERFGNRHATSARETAIRPGAERRRSVEADAELAVAPPGGKCWCSCASFAS